MEVLGALVARARPAEDLPVLEAALEALYAEATRAGSEQLEALGHALDAHAHIPAIAAWRALISFALSGGRSGDHQLAAACAAAPPRTAWLVRSDAARLIWEQRGPEDAWHSIADVEAVPADEPWQDQSPMVLQAILLKLRLAAATGRWAIHDRLVEPSWKYWTTTDQPHAVHVRIVCADHDVIRGHYLNAASTMEQLVPIARGDLLRALLCIRMHALVACASDREDTELREAIRTTRAAWHAAPGSSQQPSIEGSDIDSHALPPEEREAFEARFAQLDRHAGFLVDGQCPERATTVAEALARERVVYRVPDRRARIRGLFTLLDDCDALIRRGELTNSGDDHIKLRLLWSRLVIDLRDTGRYIDCERILDEVIDETTARGMLPLQISAYDQRAVLWTQLADPQWQKAVEDAGRAGTYASTLLGENTAAAGAASRFVMARALLRNLLPVFDRVVTLLAEHAQLVEPRNAEPRAEWSQDRRARWYRFGRALYDYVEQSHVLALQEARRAYGGGEKPVPHRFAMYVSDGSVESPLPRFQKALREHDAVLHYFVADRYLLAFVYTRVQFEWVLVDIASNMNEHEVSIMPSDAHTALRRTLERCRLWIQGSLAPDDEAMAAPFHTLLFPNAVVTILHRERVRHLRIIPHDVLYRVPFGRLRCGAEQVATRFSSSLHATGAIAAESAAHRGKHRRRKTLAYLIGPDIDNVAAEQRSIRRNMSRIAPLAQFVAVDATSSAGMESVRRHLMDADIVHFACHGSRQIQRREASLKLGGRLRLSEVPTLVVPHCGLMVLQSCWTGWMEHERTNPVQGFPQALCDIGAGAVIAPLVQVPQSLTPVFADAFYRALRFLPAERALATALDVLRKYGALLASRASHEARRDWEEYGPIDVMEYRYVGLTNMDLTGGVWRRLIGRTCFRLWCWRLRRAYGQRERLAAGSHTK
jgi:CHAT domain-containing protein